MLAFGARLTSLWDRPEINKGSRVKKLKWEFNLFCPHFCFLQKNKKNRRELHIFTPPYTSSDPFKMTSHIPVHICIVFANEHTFEFCVCEWSVNNVPLPVSLTKVSWQMRNFPCRGKLQFKRIRSEVFLTFSSPDLLYISTQSFLVCFQSKKERKYFQLLQLRFWGI